MRKKLLILGAVGVLALAACSDDNVYSDANREDFMDECQSSVGASESQCQCAWDEITENVPESEAQEWLEDEDAATPPAGITEAFETCAEA